MTGEATAIELSGVSKAFGDRQAVRDLSFDVARRSIVGVIGPSGAGKTTTLRLMLGLLEPDSGTVLVDGTPAADLTAAQRSGIGYLPQTAALLPGLSIDNNLRFHGSLSAVRDLSARRTEVLELVGLDGDRDTLVRNASGGMKRRAGLAATLLHEPSLVFLDEPTAGVDPVLRQQLWEHFDGLREAGATLVITTQYVSEALYCDRIAVISDGRLVAFDTPTGLRHSVYGGDVIDIEFAGRVPFDVLESMAELEEVVSPPRVTGNRTAEVVVREGGPGTRAIYERLGAKEVAVVSVEERFIDFDALFVQLIDRVGQP